MGADVAEAACGTALRGVGSPRGLLLVVRFEPRAKPTLDVAGTDGVDLAEFAGEHHFAGLPHQRVARVVVRDCEHDARLLDDLEQFLGLGIVEGHRLIAYDVEPGLRERLRDFEVRVVRRRDRDEIDLVRALRFGLGHLLVGAVSAVERDVVVGGGVLGFLGIGGERPGNESRAIVQHGGGGVDSADEGTLSAPDEAHAELAIERCVRGHGEAPDEDGG